MTKKYVRLYTLNIFFNKLKLNVPVCLSVVVIKIDKVWLYANSLQYTEPLYKLVCEFY